MDLALVINNRRYRASFARGSRGRVVASRTLASTIPSMEQLSLLPVLHSIPSIESGLVLVTGPAGSGKSTTLASFVNQINATQSLQDITVVMLC